MPIVGDPPAHGVRFRLQRSSAEPAGSDGSGNAIVYEGKITTAEAEFPVRIEAAADGTVTVISDAGADLAEKARLLVRTVLKHAQSEGEAPPRLIQRWRSDK